MRAERGAIVRRGDTGGYAVVISNSMLHTASPLVILCTAVRSETMAESFPNVIAVAAAGRHLYAVPVSVHTAPASAIAEVVGRATDEQLRALVRVLHAATSP